MRIRVPGDKSITQRALIFAALSDGESRLSGLLPSGDAASTAAALRMLGAAVPPLPTDGSEVRVRGVGLGSFADPQGPLDLGNSGTGARLLLGALAGCPLEAILTGDASLRARPMARVTAPLTKMGASFAYQGEDGVLPLRVRGTRPLRPLRWESPVASAQVKSALLLAGIAGGAAVTITEPRRSRDHSERMLSAMGVHLTVGPGRSGWEVALPEPPEEIEPLDLDVPGDASSAAFFLALAALGGAGPTLEIAGVGLNPTRIAFLDVLARMGARIEVGARDEVTPGGEPVGEILAMPSDLRGVTVGAEEAAGVIDELPLIAVLGARAEGETRITGASELRHKESDRIATTVGNLRLLGVEAEELPDGLVVVGSDRPLTGRVRTEGDHRIAMAFGILGTLHGNRIVVDDRDAADVSFPGFWNLLEDVTREGAR